MNEKCQIKTENCVKYLPKSHLNNSHSILTFLVFPPSDFKFINLDNHRKENISDLTVPCSCC